MDTSEESGYEGIFPDSGLATAWLDASGHPCRRTPKAVELLALRASEIPGAVVYPLLPGMDGDDALYATHPWLCKCGRLRLLLPPLALRATLSVAGEDQEVVTPEQSLRLTPWGMAGAEPFVEYFIDDGQLYQRYWPARERAPRELPDVSLLTSWSLKELRRTPLGEAVILRTPWGTPALRLMHSFGQQATFLIDRTVRVCSRQPEACGCA